MKKMMILCCLSSVAIAGNTNFVASFNAIWQTHNASNILMFVEGNVAAQTPQSSSQSLADQAITGYVGSQPQKSNTFFTEELAGNQETLDQLIRDGKM